jgi:hypothetical protein
MKIEINVVGTAISLMVFLEIHDLFSGIVKNSQVAAKCVSPRSNTKNVKIKTF